MRGIRPVDVVLAAVLSTLGVLLALVDIGSRGAAVRIDSHSWLILPVFLATTLPVLWWRRGLLAVLLITCAAMAVHVLAFGSLIRCGAGLPLVFVLAFLSALGDDPRQRWSALGLTGVLSTLVLIRDTAAGITLLPVALLISAGLFGAGRLVAARAAMASDLRQRNEDLRRLRDERAALEVSDDRAQLSIQLETLLDQRLSQLSAAAQHGGAASVAANPETAKALLATLEAGSRQTLSDMRDIVGQLRGGDVALAPAPSVAHLDALLARHLRPGSRLRVSGDPRVLPASVELSAYRIVEHLVTALASDPEVPVGVAMRFAQDALEIEVSGPVDRAADLRGALGRARERTRLHAGSLDVRVARGRARVVAHLPVLAGG